MSKPIEWYPYSSIPLEIWKTWNFSVRGDPIPKINEKSIFDILTSNDEYGYHSIGFDELNSKKLFLLQETLI